MSNKKPYDRLAWEDRFNRPTLKQLRDSIDPASRSLFDRVRKKILALDGVEEDLAWAGDTWKWTIEFRTRHSDQPLAVLIPAPEDLQLAVHMDLDFSSSLSVKRMKRSIRDGLELAQEPFHTRWAIWSVQATGLLDDIHELIAAKLNHLVRAVG